MSVNWNIKTPIYLTKHALEEGVQVVSIQKNDIWQFGSFLFIIGKNKKEGRWYGKSDWHITPLCAIVRAEEMRAARIESLQADLVKTKALVLTWDDTEESN